MKKRTVLTWSFCLLWLVSCFFVGQWLHPTIKSDSKKLASTEVITTDVAEALPISQESVDSTFVISYQNRKEVSTDDIPWGFNVGEIILENGNKAWLLTHDASIEMSNVAGKTLAAYIHPWMAEVSDGTVLTMFYLQDDIEVLLGKMVVGLDVVTWSVPKSINHIILKLEATEHEDGDWCIIIPD